MKQKLIDAVIKNKGRLSYVNLDEKNAYRGWTADFNIKVADKNNMNLDLNEETDLFLLFVLASSWSKTGPWENAAFFTTYLKANQKDNIKLWLDDNFVNDEISKSGQNANCTVRLCSGVIPRKKVSFRKDYYSSIAVIARNWAEIKSKLEVSTKENNYRIFINYISELEGLGAGQNKMRIKIPLILRELRCQKVYDNIPGELCCVPDERVKVSSKEIGIPLPHINSMDSLLKASKIIYDNFGDLYDIPLFAYEDIKEDIL
jgi:hypothetical protein